MTGAPPRIHELPARWAAERPEALALDDGEKTVSWRALDHSVAACTSLLQGLGVRPGDRVMLVAENSRALIASLFSASALGATAVIVNPRLSAREMDGIREHAQPRCLLFAAEVAAECAAHAQRLAAEHVDVADVGRLGVLASRADGPPTEDVAAIVYTSGTSGRPKGVMLTHGNLRFIAEASARVRELEPSDRVFGALPIYHVYGLASVLLGTMWAGGCLVTVARFDAIRALEMLSRGGLTVFQGVPAMYARMLEQMPAGTPFRAPRLRYLYAGGSPLDPAIKANVESRFGMPLHNGYGLTECSPTVSQTRLRAPRTDTSVGPPIDGIEVRIVAPEAPAATPEGIGELWVRGPNVMRGYYRDPEATAQAITPDGWLRTGDLARLASDGALFIVGRSKELIIRSGLNVYPIEVEAVLNAHPAVTQSVVVGRTLADGNEEVVAFVELKPGTAATPAELVAHAAAGLAPYKRPSDLRIMEALPESATGKVLRGQLKQLAQ